MCNKYRFRTFVWDVTMVCLTGGFWFIWIFCRESRRKKVAC